MKSFTSDEYVVIRLETGDDVLEAIREASGTENIETGAVVSGIGTLKRLEIHYLHTDDLEAPTAERNERISSENCWEVSGINGVIADGDPHLHLTAFDGTRTVAGHVEEGCIVNALGEIVLLRIDDLSLTRGANTFGVDVLTSKTDIPLDS